MMKGRERQKKEEMYMEMDSSIFAIETGQKKNPFHRIRKLFANE